MKTSSFQIAITIVCIVGAIVAVGMFSGYIPSGSKAEEAAEKAVTITIWGTFKRLNIMDVVKTFNAANPLIKLSYTEFVEDSLADKLTEAYANGSGPDLIIIDNENFAEISKRVTPIPLVSFSDANFRQTFISEGENFLFTKGVMALPILVDPMIMYYNKSLFDGAAISAPPVTWEEALSMAPLLTKKDASFNITQSALALGSFSNINNAKDILSMILMQYGNPVFVKSNNTIVPVLSSGSQDNTASPAESALQFYTGFTDPSKDYYTWSRQELPSRDAFLSEDLAMYFGYASELPALRKANYNLSLDIAKVPQIKDTKTALTFGHIYGIAVAKSSKKASTAVQAAILLSNSTNALTFAKVFNLPPARRDLLAKPPASPYHLKTFYQSALMSRAFLDTDINKTTEVFENMVNKILTNRENISNVISEANNNLVQVSIK